MHIYGDFIMSENFKRLQYIVGQQLGVPSNKIKPET